ncbi:EamA family transporter [Romboutsia weinsteinii]|uniref:EamA family transporter n=1 Tax=Romboutsia weinsteinii TaxID=2020949 RepID=A0A371J6N0_9FIRM|nr:EamA family transporter [Romboutsia weinsteinii]RDY28395.1 EamA family transporter [Romboutsia weinsteinii]
MWIMYAFASALFAGITSILAKIGIKNTDSNLATALRSIVILLFAWAMVFIVGSQNSIYDISSRSLVFLILSGLTTGGSWICYFKALQLGDVNKVVPIDKSSTILTMVLAFVLLGEEINIYMTIGMIAIGFGTYLMIEKKEQNSNYSVNKSSNISWIVYAFLSAIFASMTSILSKIGIENVESNLGTAIRTIVVLIMAWVIVFMMKKQGEIKNIDKKSWIFICLSGLTTGLSWLFYYKALQEGKASIVVPIDKLSILVTVSFAYIFLKEKLTKKSFIGLILVVFGTLVLII